MPVTPRGFFRFLLASGGSNATGDFFANLGFFLGGISLAGGCFIFYAAPHPGRALLGGPGGKGGKSSLWRGALDKRAASFRRQSTSIRNEGRYLFARIVCLR